MGEPKKVYVAATARNDGKTTVSIGLVRALQARGLSAGFIKPVGQRYVDVDGQHIDEDSVLIRHVCELAGDLRSMSPIAIERGFTRRFLDDADDQLPELERMIEQAFAEASRDKDVMVIEGTGHAGVGSCFNLSNARVAEILGAKAVIVTPGGIGRPLDEIHLSQLLFERHGVPVIGAIANKCIPGKLDQMKLYMGKGLHRMNMELLGTIPFAPRLTWPSVRQVRDEVHCEVINGEENLDNAVASIVVGAMSLHNALRHIRPGCLLITPGDREDLLLAVLMVGLLSKKGQLAGVLLTGGIRPRSPAMKILRETNIPVLVSREPTYETSSHVHEMVVKIREEDHEKVLLASDIVRRHLDLDRLLEEL